MEDRNKLAFGRKNYLLMLATIGALMLGFILMSLDTETYGFGFLGLTLGPLLLVIGFALGFFAILVKDKPAE
ncbi:Protein of unknown function [Catalinimonas alkaloidigena]|uniref:DUF3098 domain-containing protein n=1 Tax=Catalinimonas alkaloidigena TaxID=1075417 RepID=A0A1G9AG94_9BACT|nr:DUF3098 domain-containing protein [Catalinimonas alkaloidigena]SDK26396.1 Protein of unknown function [Catalinimonas alkaloidigena]